MDNFNDRQIVGTVQTMLDKYVGVIPVIEKVVLFENLEEDGDAEINYIEALCGHCHGEILTEHLYCGFCGYHIQWDAYTHEDYVEMAWQNAEEEELEMLNVVLGDREADTCNECCAAELSDEELGAIVDAIAEARRLLDEYTNEEVCHCEDCQCSRAAAPQGLYDDFINFVYEVMDSDFVADNELYASFVDTADGKAFALKKVNDEIIAAYGDNSVVIARGIFRYLSANPIDSCFLIRRLVESGREYEELTHDEGVKLVDYITITDNKISYHWGALAFTSPYVLD